MKIYSQGDETLLIIPVKRGFFKYRNWEIDLFDPKVNQAIDRA